MTALSRRVLRFTASKMDALYQEGFVVYAKENIKNTKLLFTMILKLLMFTMLTSTIKANRKLDLDFKKQLKSLIMYFFVLYLGKR